MTENVVWQRCAPKRACRCIVCAEQVPSGSDATSRSNCVQLLKDTDEYMSRSALADAVARGEKDEDEAETFLQAAATRARWLS